ncbi:MAG: peptidylprolyl isomerase [Phycisphaerae bacterium]|nr:peptidylprolyl isomerase [Phycisphaerae bacterium]
MNSTTTMPDASLRSAAIRAALALLATISMFGVGSAMRAAPPSTQPAAPKAPATPPVPPAPAPAEPAAKPPKGAADRSKPAPTDLFAKITTSRGTFRVALHAAETPLTVTNFCNLARKGFFDGLPVHLHTRVMRGSGRPFEGFHPEWTFRREFSPKLRFEQAGCMAMLRLGEGTAGTTNPTEWFVTVKQQPRWTLDIPIFASVVEGQSVVDQLRPDDSIVSVVIDGDPSPLFARYAKEIAAWDEGLARSGWPRKSGAPSAPDSSTPPSAPGSAKPPAQDPATPPAPSDTPARTPPAAPPSTPPIR